MTEGQGKHEYPLLFVNSIDSCVNLEIEGDLLTYFDTKSSLHNFVVMDNFDFNIFQIDFFSGILAFFCISQKISIKLLLYTSTTNC